MASKLYTIGFTKKSAREFFELLKEHQIKKIIDIRLSNTNQLAGFTKKNDLEYFLKEIADIKYFYAKDFAPTKELMIAKRERKISMDKFEEEFTKILKKRKVENIFNEEELNQACLLCSEEQAKDCHRNAITKYLKGKYQELEVVDI
jgi:uncharacterized protein (DUF488 family)